MPLPHYVVPDSQNMEVCVFHLIPATLIFLLEILNVWFIGELKAASFSI